MYKQLFKLIQILIGIEWISLVSQVIEYHIVHVLENNYKSKRGDPITDGYNFDQQMIWRKGNKHATVHYVIHQDSLKFSSLT